ncbi:MAG: hypothetical protein HYU83_01485 [Chloroflexi bacterium]|nr:hypothetical protein [Chloroflexota bacterium]
MEIKAAVGDIAKIETDAIVVNFFEGMKHPEGDTATIDKALGGTITQLIKQGEIKGKINQITVIHTQGKLPAARVVVTGLGLLRAKYVESIATTAQGAGIAGITVEDAAQAVTEGALLGLYSFRRHLTKEAEYGEIKQLTLADRNKTQLRALEQGCRKGKTDHHAPVRITSHQEYFENIIG